MTDTRTRTQHLVCELMNSTIVFNELPENGDTYVYTHEEVEYNFIFDEDHWELQI